VSQNLCTYFICVIDTACTDLKVCTTHGLHLNSWDKKKLTYLTAKRWVAVMRQAWAVFLLWFM